MAIGVMIGTWLQSGTIATIIAWGLKMINPAWLLPLTLLFCSVLSVVTGTSYGSVGSAGVAMMAIGNAMGINPGMVAGAVILSLIHIYPILWRFGLIRVPEEIEKKMGKQR